ncbi:MAG: alpha/beta fold hydrolase [Xanthomonadales bacterium]|nr:alpha/beta fold hydrolase [Xanthomonadales bacterium]
MTRCEAAEFVPPVGLRNPHVQSLLNSSGLRRRVAERRATHLLRHSEDILLDGGDGVRLLGHYSAHPGRQRPLAVLFHGWEGSAQSNYVLGTGARLYEDGFNVFRLNFRDHGDSHHLNPGVFHSCRLPEVVNALVDLQRRLAVPHWFLAGFSLGGNFALRVGLAAPSSGLSVRRIVAICPVIRPDRVLDQLERGRGWYGRYFERKWGRSMRLKQAHWPDRYDYEEWFKLRGLRERTRFLATEYYQYETLDQYFDGYTIADDRLSSLTVPSLVLTAADDPVVPVSDFENLPEIPALEVRVAPYGGHCGFISSWRLDSWVESVISNQFQAASEQESEQHDRPGD